MFICKIPDFKEKLVINRCDECFVATTNSDCNSSCKHVLLKCFDNYESLHITLNGNSQNLEPLTTQYLSEKIIH